MMPTIRVDDDVYEALRNRGKTGDSFSDVLRPLLGLGSMGRRAPGPSSAKEGVKTGLDEGALGRLDQIASKYLPPHWNDAPQRRNQILATIATFVSQPSTTASVADRHLLAAKHVAATAHVKLTTVIDKCGRQLYGVGEPDQMGRFRTALMSIEADWRALEIRP